MLRYVYDIRSLVSLMLHLLCRCQTPIVLVILSSRLFSIGISGWFFSTNLTNPERIKYLGLFFRKNTAIAGVFSSLGAFSKYVCWFFHGQIFPSISPQWETTIIFIYLSTHKKIVKNIRYCILRIFVVP